MTARKKRRARGWYEVRHEDSFGESRRECEKVARENPGWIVVRVREVMPRRGKR